MLLPAEAEVARQLRRYRAWERAMLAAPSDRAVRAMFEDSGHTLCVLMGKRCAREAANAAERRLRGGPGDEPREQGARPRHNGGVRRAPPARRRSQVAGH
ncbi:DUF5133 domain-containing protein [Streptomyces sp. NPDC006012]|uniref:DUF5133 domain-containing protein n=1 Tax=Streptomyces sp. NPDC006012 TaxID=3364739 RepID=UPI00368F64CF